MATTNASKFGLRKAAEEKRNRHAQRTPLPPRAGVVEAARRPIDDRETAEGGGIHPSVAHGERIRGGQERKRARRAARMAVAASYSDPKSGAKAEAFGERCSQEGWQHEIQTRGEVTELTATRGPETIVQAWRNGVWQWDASVYAFADRTTKPRNASGAGRLLERPAAEAAAEATKVAANNSFRRKAPTDLAPIALPLDPELLTDEEAAKFFRGQTVRWYNRLSRSTETAMVSRQSTIRVTRWEGETTVSFCCPVTGFRAFHLSAVLAVGRGKSGVTAGSQTATVELEDAA